jgi:hypothetical protein
MTKRTSIRALFVNNSPRISGKEGCKPIVGLLFVRKDSQLALSLQDRSQHAIVHEIESARYCSRG